MNGTEWQAQTLAAPAPAASGEETTLTAYCAAWIGGRARPRALATGHDGGKARTASQGCCVLPTPVCGARPAPLRASHDCRQVLLWDAGVATLVLNTPGTNRVRCLSAAPRGHALLAATEGGAVVGWAAVCGAPVGQAALARASRALRQPAAATAAHAGSTSYRNESAPRGPLLREPARHAARRRRTSRACERLRRTPRRRFHCRRRRVDACSRGGFGSRRWQPRREWVGCSACGAAACRGAARTDPRQLRYRLGDRLLSSGAVAIGMRRRWCATLVWAATETGRSCTYSSARVPQEAAWPCTTRAAPSQQHCCGFHSVRRRRAWRRRLQRAVRPA